MKPYRKTLLVCMVMMLAVSFKAPAAQSEPMAMSHLDAHDKSVPVNAPTDRAWIGVTVPRATVDVAARRNGVVESVGVRVGDAVSQGALLASLDTGTLQEELRIATSALAVARAQAEREAVLAKQKRSELGRRVAAPKLVSVEEQQAAKMAAAAASAAASAAAARIAEKKAEIAKLRRLLEQANITAPFAGIIALRYLEPGASVTVGTPIVRLVSASTLVYFAVPESELDALAPGRRVTIELEVGAKTFGGVVERVSPEVDVASQMVFAEARIETSEPIQAGLAAFACPRRE